MTLKANHKYRLLVEISNKTSNINSRVYFGKANANISDFSIPTMVGNGIYYKDYMPTENVGLTQYSVIGAQSVGETSLTMKIAIYDITANVINKYTKYFTPIELNKIGNYQDFIRKGTGKNLADTEKVNLGKTLSNSGELLNGMNNRTTIFQIAVKPSTQYSLSVASSYQIGNIFYYKEDGTHLTTLGSGWGNNKVVTTPSGAYYISFATRVSTDATMAESDLTNLHIQIEENSSVTYYEPYGYKDKWYIEKNIGKYKFLGTENWQTFSYGTNSWRLSGIAYYNLKDSVVSIMSNIFQGIAKDNKNQEISNSIYVDSLNIFTIRNTTLTSKTEVQNATKDNYICYVLATPTYTLIENEELIEQLNRIYLQQGLNNILVNGNLPSTLKMTYVSDLIGIDEEQLKDINVNFGEKYGPINSLVIARAADSDFIYKEDEKSVAEDGLCEVKISDNQILNGDNRTQFIDEMFNQLRGTEFYLNDFSSTGITYLDLLDYYIVKVFDNSYKCLMLNDEINITQGLQEQVFTERLKESETEYKSIAKQDKDIKKIGIIVNKVKGEITAEVEARKGTDTEVSRISQTSSEINERLEATETTLYDSENGLVNKVTTHSLDIKKTADGLEIEVGRVDVLKDDVKALDDNTLDIRDNFLFNEDGLTIRNKGSDTQDMKLNLTNEAIKFLYQNRAMLTINGSKIEFSSASFEKLDLGNYVWQAEDDDSLSLIYEGD